jgi:S-adenosylmethionine-diacylglycerol 3-amino-3-carboxypropyl transferase
MQATASRLLLHDAVHQAHPLSRAGLAQRLFSWWFDGFVYNQIWEDPRVDLAALELRPDSQVLTIASGGCNVLNYLQAEPAAITAVDLNPHHMRLTRLKLACLEHLPDYDSFFAFFGKAGEVHNVHKYFTYVSPHLDPDTRAYWEDKRGWQGKRRIHLFAENFYRHARSGYFLRFIHHLARTSGADFGRLLQARDMAEQEHIFTTEIAPLFEHWLVKFLGKRSFAVFSLGIPPQQCEHMRAEGDLLEIYKSRVKRLACGFPISDNYFAWQAFGLRYDHEKRHALPDYLKPEYYATLKRQVRRISTHVTSLGAYLKQQPAHSLDRFVLLDAQDWMKPALIQDLWEEIARVGKPGARIIFRTAASASPLENALPTALAARFEYLQARGQELHTHDRAAIYGGFHLYVLK